MAVFTSQDCATQSVKQGLKAQTLLTSFLFAAHNWIFGSAHKSHNIWFCPQITQHLVLPTNHTTFRSAHKSHNISFCPQITQHFVLPTNPTTFCSAHKSHTISFCPQIPQHFVLPTNPTTFGSAHKSHNIWFCPQITQHFTPRYVVVMYRNIFSRTPIILNLNHMDPPNESHVFSKSTKHQHLFW
jgi:hypothetical protein